MSETPLTRKQAIERLVDFEPDIRALDVQRIALFGSVARAKPVWIVMSTFWFSSSRAQRHTTAP